MTRARDLSKFLSEDTRVATTAFVPDTADGATLGTSALEFSDLFLADSGTIKFGADQDVTITHNPDSGLDIIGGEVQTIVSDTVTSAILKLNTHATIQGSVFLANRSSPYANMFEGLYFGAKNHVHNMGNSSSNYFKIRNFESSDPSTAATELFILDQDELDLHDDLKLSFKNGRIARTDTGTITDGFVIESIVRDLSLKAYRSQVEISAGSDASDFQGRKNLIVKETGVELYGGLGYNSGSNNTPIKYLETTSIGVDLSPGDTTAKVGIGTLSTQNYGSYDTELNIGGDNSARIKLAATSSSLGLGSGTNDGFDIYQYQNNANLLNKENGWLRFSTNNTVRGLISNVGNWGINTSNPSYGLDVNTTAIFRSTVQFLDYNQIQIGNSDDFVIFHDPSTGNLIKANNAHNTFIQTDGGLYLGKKNAAGYYIICNNGSDNAVQLRHNNSTKLLTTSSGVTVTGTCTATAFSGDGSALTGISGGKVAQVQNVVKSDTFSTNTSSPDGVAISGLQVNITPSASSSKVLVTVSLGAIGCSTSASRSTTFQLYRGSTQIGEANASGSRPRVTFRSWMTSGDTNHALGGLSFTFLDTPNTTGALSYKLHMSGSHDSQTFFLNRSGSGSNGSGNYQANTISTMQCMEILA